MSNNNFKTHYDNLKVSRDAPPEVIKAAYRSLIQKYHPDRNNNSEESQRIIAILNNSYSVLSNPESRQSYDNWIKQKLNESSQNKPRTLKSKTSSYQHYQTDNKSDISESETVFFQAYLKKYNVSEQELNQAIWKSKIKSMKIGGNTFVEDKPIINSATVNNSSRSVFLIIFILTLISFFVFSYNSTSTKQPAIPKELPTYQESLLPQSGVLSVSTIEPLIAPFSITASSTQNHLVKLKDSITGNDIVSIFIRAGETVKTKVPLGTYTQVYASGNTWYGNKLLFGRRTVLSKSLTAFSFYKSGNRIRGHQVTLQNRVNGNLRSSRISQNEFE
ncbi:hypothetical protein THMIRHAM_20590 [Thiomicrorhabdus immobilis]|uniref:J domain-containing protein n=1 Tax=Thiomicrorhabdus immobilis TaxID=2791037 RepID=A0ABN6D018_9GAMM|nr:J domain-containing protein [Thiomicrorhabdus immobilis]BCN94274.1 hypothetical protein THMIRHAM_20590 [Thiomicrorhabdus immobilis]